MKDLGQRISLRKTARLVLLFACYAILGVGIAFTQESEPGPRLQIASVDRSEFPALGVNLILTDEQSRPLDALQGLRLRENGVPIGDYTQGELKAGIDLFLVVDASISSEAVDENGQNRLQLVRDSIVRFSGRYMDSGDRDHVTVIIPGGETGRTLIADISDPAVLSRAISAYEPAGDADTPLINMLELAVQRATATVEAGRFQAVVVFTDGLGQNRFMFLPLAQEAQSLQLPFFFLLLGGQAGDTVIETLSWLYEPTRGLQVAVSDIADGEPLFLTLQANGTQLQLRYESNLTRSGSYPLTASLREVRDEFTLDLEIAAPRVDLVNPEEVIRRVGTTPDDPLPELQPTTQPLVVRVSWPDGIPRRLEEVRLLANGTVQDAPVSGSPGELTFDWRISDLDAGQYSLTVLVTDTLGLVGQSLPVSVQIAVERPDPPPPPTVAPTSTPVPMSDRLLAGAPFLENGPIGLIGLLTVLVIAGFLLRRRQRKKAQGKADEETLPSEVEIEPSQEDRSATEATTAWLEPTTEPGTSVELRGTSVTIGREENAVQVRLDDDSVSPLHARIRRIGDAFWLYDEGSTHGTFLNYERLSLAPRRLKDGDEILLGRVRFHFRLANTGLERDVAQENS